MISVCMASCDGERFIAEQIDSILSQLSTRDELIIVDDCSQDQTLKVINSFNRDPRLRLQQTPQRTGHVDSFAQAISLAQGEFIFLADQDDVWPEGRLERMVKAFTEPDVNVVAGNFSMIDENRRPLGPPQVRLLARYNVAPWRNILGILLGRRAYYGCCMAFRRPLCRELLPIPRSIESHDLWIAMVGNRQNSVKHLEESVLLKREHETNVSSPIRRPWPVIIRSRLGMLKALLTALQRARKPATNNAG
ncbi:glycosyltransferase [Gilvimarinus xylanilyticus]